jgi:hypothetical protein
MPKDLVFELSPTQAAFVHSTAQICHLVGGFGEGKTFAGVAAMIAHAQRCRQNIRTCLLRDTHVNIKTATVPSIKEILGDWVRFQDNYKKMYIQTKPPIECDLFGIDDPASESKLQGPEYALIWLEEPAPIHEKSNAGLPRSVYELALARASRQKRTQPRVQITQNPGDETHWTTELLDEPEEYMTVEIDGETITIIKHTFRIPKGENKHLSRLSRAMNMAAFKDDPGKWERYVEGRTATVQIGRAVTPNYNPLIHFSQKILPVYPGLPAVRGWDSYQHPCCGTFQVNPHGQLVVHDVLMDEGIGPQELIDEQIMPLLNSPKWKNKVPAAAWREIGDPTMRTPDQSTTARTTARIITDRFGTRFEPGPTRWPARIEPVTYHLKRLVGAGLPAILLSASALPLHKALRGGWRWKTDNSGRIVGKTPVKNEHSHAGDMFSYVVSVLMPYSLRAEVNRAERAQRSHRRAESYGMGGAMRRPFIPVAGRMM